MSANEIIALIIGVLVAEGTEIAPWLAKTLARWSAHMRHLDPRRAEIRAEELEAVIESRPGKLFKLATALLFAAQAGGTWGFRLLTWMQLSWQIRQQLNRSQADPSAAANVRVFLTKSDDGRDGMLINTHWISNGLDTGDIDTVQFRGLPPADLIVQRVGRMNRHPTC
ncbi:hypothetical protein ACGF0J_16440 [Nonomuraea sp. NPDC047897]|uniref:hypothetical protein n=1 Tax=Nonomuraea sp. NPDC047897 TaxID=3364346 RepID=UPI00371AF92A